MAISRYLCRILFLETDQAQSGLSTKYSNISHIDKKQFTIGSSSEADIRIKGEGVDALHLAVKIDGPHLLIKNLSKGNTLISTFKVPPDKIEPYKSGEAIRLGQSKQVIMIELFRKFVEPHDESEAIVREAWEKAKEAEGAAADQRQVLALLNKQAIDLKEETEKEIAELIERGKKKADEIHESALKAKEHIMKVAEQEAVLAAQRAEKEVERTINEINLSAEEKTRKLMDQGRQKSKEIRQEAEREVEGILAAGQREAELLIENAKKQAKEYTEESKLEFQALHTKKNEIQTEISEYQAKLDIAIGNLAFVKTELKKFEDSKLRVQREYELEKERLRLSGEELQKQIEIQESEKRAIEAEVESFTVHFNKMTAELADTKSSTQKELERCNLESQQAMHLKEKAKNETEHLEISLKELRKNANNLQTEYTTVKQRITDLKDEEYKEREKIRSKLNKEYAIRKEFEENWHTKQRLIEQDQLLRERTAKAKLEAIRLHEQAQIISEKIQPLISLELAAQFGEEQSMNFKPQFEKMISPIVHRCVVEEYEFRRDNWEIIRPFSFARELSERAKIIKRQVGVTTLSLLFLLAALFVSWTHYSGLQEAYMSSQSPKAIKESSLNSQ